MKHSLANLEHHGRHSADGCMQTSLRVVKSDAAPDTRSQGHGSKLSEQLLLLAAGRGLSAKSRAFCPINATSWTLTQHLESIDDHSSPSSPPPCTPTGNSSENPTSMRCWGLRDLTSQDNRWQNREETGRFLALMQNEPHARSFVGILLLRDARLNRTAERSFLYLFGWVSFISCHATRACSYYFLTMGTTIERYHGNHDA